MFSSNFYAAAWMINKAFNGLFGYLMYIVKLHYVHVVSFIAKCFMLDTFFSLFVV